MINALIVMDVIESLLFIGVMVTVIRGQKHGN